MCLSHSWHKLYNCAQMEKYPGKGKIEGICHSFMILELTSHSMGLPHQPNALDNRFADIGHFSESCGEPMWQRQGQTQIQLIVQLLSKIPSFYWPVSQTNSQQGVGSTGPKTVSNVSVSVTSRKHISMQYVISMQ